MRKTVIFGLPLLIAVILSFSFAGLSGKALSKKNSVRRDSTTK